MASKEIKSLTGIRGIAAVGVMLYHYFIFAEWVYNDLRWENIVFILINKMHLFVDLFFLLSAFVLALSYEKVFSDKITVQGYKEFFKKRVIRIYPLYLFNIICFLILFYKTDIDWKQLLINLSFMNVLFDISVSYNFVAWSLSSEFIAYLIFPFLFWIITKSKNLKWIGLTLAAGGYMIVDLDLKPYFIDHDTFKIETFSQSSTILGSNALIRCISSYIIGIILAQYRDNLRHLVKFEYILIPIWFILSFYETATIWTILVFSSLIIALYHRSKIEILFSNKIAYTLGIISYSIYLNHTIVSTIFSKLTSGYSETIFVVSSIAVTLIVSYFTYLLVEKELGLHVRNYLLSY